MQGDRPHVLLVTIPVAPPWDNASKNRALQIGLRMKNHRIHILGRRGSGLPGIPADMVVEEVYGERDGLTGKLRLFKRLIRRDEETELYHFFFQPNPFTARVMGSVVNWNKKPAIQTILNVIESGRSVTGHIFGHAVPVVSSAFMRDRLKYVGLTKTRLIRPGVDCRRFTPDRTNDQLRDRLGLPAGPAVLYPAEYTSERGFDLFLTAMRTVSARYRDTVFVLAGRIFGRKDEILESKAKQAVREHGLEARTIFTGTYDDMTALISICDLVVFPARSMIDKMDLPLTLLEAAAMAKPIVISDMAPLNEVMAAEAGLMTPPGDANKLAAAMMELIGDETRRRQMGAIGRKMAVDRFNVDREAAEYEHLYQEVIHGLN